MSIDIRFHTLLAAEINKSIVDRSMSCGNGNLQSHDAYKRETGIIHGLKLALEIASDVEKTLFAPQQEKP